MHIASSHKSHWLLPVILCACVLFAALPTSSADLLTYASCDLRVLYLLDNPEAIDWGTLYYLNDVYGAHVSLIVLNTGPSYQANILPLPETEFDLSTYTLPDSGAKPFDSVLSALISSRPADIVLLGGLLQGSMVDSIGKLLTSQATELGLSRIYQMTDSVVGKKVVAGSVYINAREQVERYRERMEREIPHLFSWYTFPKRLPENLMRYELAWSAQADAQPRPDFVSGLPPIRLSHVLDSALPEGALKQALLRKARNYESFVSLAKNSLGKKRADYLLTGYKELSTLSDQCRVDSRLSTIPRFLPYLRDMNHRLQQAVAREIGLTWSGEIIMRESPDGPKVKFRASIGADGPTQVELDAVRFKPYWDTTSVVLDSAIRKIEPHQTLIREYLVGVDRQFLEAQKPESLLFAADIVYGQMPFTLYSSVPIWQSPDLTVKFEPNFKFIPATAQLVVDRVVSSMSWLATLSKPAYYYGKVNIKIETPRGMFAGAYQTERTLEKGRSLEILRIPFTVSNLFELGIQKASISLLVNGRTVASDTGLIRVASCHIDDTIKIGFLPDSTGRIEDVLRMTDAAFQPLTVRALTTSDLDAYKVIVIGSGAFVQYPVLRELKGRLEDFVRGGGRIVLFGQPPQWPEGVLPIGCNPGIETVRPQDVLNRGNGGRILTKPYAISDDILLQWLGPKHKVASAVVSPAEAIYVTPSGADLLSVTRIGSGEIVYCGLPLEDMIASLNIEAIHLFANLLNH
jgi:hypothetical protein